MPLFGSKTDISMELANDVVVAGEPVHVALTIGEPDKKVRSGRLELVYRNEYQKDERDMDDDGPSSTRTVTKREDVVAAVMPLFDGGPVQEGRHELEIVVPPDAPGTASDDIVWRVRAVIDRKMGNDAEAEAPIKVVVPATQLAGWASTPGPPSERCRMMLDLSTRAVKPGEQITGTLRIAPLEPVNGRGVRVQLKRERNDPDNNSDVGEYAVVQLTGEGSMPAGADETIPFTIHVPSDAPPSFRARYNEQRWYVEGVIDVARKFDPVVRMEVLVHTA